MKSRAGFGSDGRRLRLLLSGFFLALAVPTAILVYQAYQQLKWESFHHHRILAEESATRIDARLSRLVAAEEGRSFSDYAFLVVAGDPAANLVQRSPLSKFPVEADLPGLLGWFQLDADGVFSTPLVPQSEGSYGIPQAELQRRAEAQAKLWEILGQNRLVQPRGETAKPAEIQKADKGRERAKLAESAAESDGSQGQASGRAQPAPAAPVAPAQSAFDAISSSGKDQLAEKRSAATARLGKVEDLNLGMRYQSEAESPLKRDSYANSPPMEKRPGRKERGAVPESVFQTGPSLGRSGLSKPPLRVATFESEIDPLEFARLASGHYVLFRKVWRDGQRYIQGLLIDSTPFLRDLIESDFRATALSRMSRLVVADRGEILAGYSVTPERNYLGRADELRGDLLYRTRLSAPLSDIELIFTVDSLPAGPGGALVVWLSGILAVVLCGGFAGLYRLGLRQIEVAGQQQDFISAVSHELKTPLTSIRMYGEMLKAGWVSEDKKPSYYDFIYTESERLSRLIANVLQLARMTRNSLILELKATTGSELLDIVRSKVVSHIERAGFELGWAVETPATEALVQADADAFAQVAINLVDNALKFSAKSDRKTVDIGLRLLRDRSLVFSVRDYGPGVPRDQMRKIFKLFYRLENELTRETVGTGIGLALVRQLSHAMGATIDVSNLGPGAEFRVVFRALGLVTKSPSAGDVPGCGEQREGK